MKTTWKVGTRGSKLALRQTEIVLDNLRQHYPCYEFIVKVIKTTGDTVWDKPLHLIGAKGLFVKEIEEDLLTGEIDFAIHSVKDLPTDLGEHLTLAAVLKREDPRDAFLSLIHDSIAGVRQGGRIGTSSLRRKAQISSFRSDLEVMPLRGNVDTRIRKMEKEGLDGILLAYAGAKRMGLAGYVREILPYTIMVPPSGQGAIGVETRRDDDALTLIGPLNDSRSFREITLERRLQAAAGGGCQIPLGINIALANSEARIHIFLGKENGETLYGARRVIPAGDVDGVLEDMGKDLKKLLV
jgi:hydroxymethylbilane synthase